MAIYPDPDSVVYPTTYPPAYPCRIATRTVSRGYPIHEHGVYADLYGNGNTDAVVGHFHYVRNGVVLPAVDGHTHDITTLPCGVG